MIATTCTGSGTDCQMLKSNQFRSSENKNLSMGETFQGTRKQNKFKRYQWYNMNCIPPAPTFPQTV